MEHLFPALIVGNDAVSLKELKRILLDAGYPVSLPPKGVQVVHFLTEKFFPILIMDGSMPEMDALELCRRIRQEQFPGYVYVMMLQSQNSEGNVLEALEAGADQCFLKPADPKELLVRLKTAERILELESSLNKRKEEFKILSLQDPLTGAFNRAYLHDQIPNEIKRSYRYSQSLSIILCDIDGFKEINDAHGHLAGDGLLKELVDLLQKSIRDGVDWIARYGGDEFLIVLPNTDLKGARIAAKRLCHSISGEVFMIKNQSVRVTASFGVTGIDLNRKDTPITPELLLEEADESLYKAKNSGGNRIEIHPSKELLISAKDWDRDGP